ncbi:alpha-glucuronidase family glycosyl hydrolase [Acidipila sp. EB88]|uniref:alpha-glucuronidase family glycosyl hydrolase n=1 Tax=Acidipila sp. EB88 TaxID=2305226 RepID=UPI000F603779|nr:alpha-glucuronidase family glycosyl hydrolase [Acidipila sp. EB88]RRA47464.1 glucosiduronase [Acidipila sp. EB88]
MLRAAICVLLLAGSHSAGAEDGSAGWLRYAPLTGASRAACQHLPTRLVVLGGEQPTIARAAQELQQGLAGMCGITLQVVVAPGSRPAFVLGTIGDLKSAKLFATTPALPGAEGFTLAPSDGGYLIAGADARGVLYGSFAMLRMLAMGERIRVARSETPAAQVRWTNEWDNLDGSIERGYAGRSIFFENGRVRSDLGRVGFYGRLLSSVGINGITINNVNADVRMLTPEIVDGVARIAAELRPFGVRVSLAVDFSSPKAIGGLDTFDPLDPAVARWWAEQIEALYRKIPDFAGFTVKADSEGKPGPSQYGRTPAQAANMLAAALKPHGGVVLYRAFVYNHHLDWNDLKADRARAAYDIFHPLDGTFADNVILQIKNGPIDFQVREPVSPLFAGLRKTDEAIELEVSQEYTGQQRHLVYLVPQWKTYLDTDMRVDGHSAPLQSIVEGQLFHRPVGGFIGVANVGLDTNWMAHPLAMANLYGFGRLAWNPGLSSERIVDEWTRQSFGNKPLVDHVIEDMQLRSWSIYENYTGPLGLGTLVDIIGPHFGPGPASAEHNGWGQWLRADAQGIGMDRTVATGTGYTGQYPRELAAQYEDIAQCPEPLLLFMHHVPYTYRLHSGESVVQHVYDTHYDGAEQAMQLVSEWQSLARHIDAERYSKVLALQRGQAGFAIVWRDTITNWFAQQSGVADAQGRVGHLPDRIEAESMQLHGYQVHAATPSEMASGGNAVTCATTRCTASTVLDRPAGWYRLSVGYYDYHDGASRFTLTLNGNSVGQWSADDDLPMNNMSGTTATRWTHWMPLALSPGDTLQLTATPQGGEPAPVDYLELTPVATPAHRTH